MIIEEILNGVSRKFIVKTYALQKSLNKLGVSLSDLDDVFNNRFFDFTIAMMFYSAEYACYKDEKSNDFIENDVFDWIDEMGGVASPKMINFISAIKNSVGVSEDSTQEQRSDLKKKNEKTSPLRKTA